MPLPCGINIQNFRWKILSLFAQICPFILIIFVQILIWKKWIYTFYLLYHGIIADCRKSVLFFLAVCAIVGIGKAPTPKWMLPSWLNVLTDTAYPVCWQDRHFYFFLLFLLSRKVRNATIKLPKEISKPIIPINIKIISAAVISRTSLPKYS